MKSGEVFSEMRNVKLDDLFNIAPSNIMDLIKNEEDKQFFVNQLKKGHVGCMTSIDLKLHQKEVRVLQRKVKEKERFDRHAQQVQSAKIGR